MSDTLRWGILAPGKIAHAFAHDLAHVPGAELVAVGSRSRDRAAAFTAEHGGRPHPSYDALLDDPEVDVVYVASPHALHLEHAGRALAAGKHVLCEKPLTLTAAEGEQLVALAREHDRFLMEAMWTACHPVVREVARRVRSGELGAARHLHAELGFVVDAAPEDRMLARDLGGGALLDMGVYPLTFAHLLLGGAERLGATADLGAGGVDLDVAVTGRYPGGALATLTASMTSWSSRTASLATDLGRLEVVDFHHPTHATFHPHDGEPVRIEAAEPVLGRGYGNEAAEVARCLREGLRESPWVPHEQTLTILRQMDALRREIGVTYAADGR